MSHRIFALRQINKDKTSYGGFVNPTEVGAIIQVPDWNPNNECGGGIHCWPWGLGVGDGKSVDLVNSLFQVISDEEENFVLNIEGGLKAKCKQPRVEFTGTFADAMKILLPMQIEKITEMANAATSGDRANAATSGDRANAATSGKWANVATSGVGANAATSGDRANAATSGKWANAATSGKWANVATSGVEANAATSGNWANAATSGHGANAATSGHGANAATSGNGAKAVSCEGNAYATGNDSIAISLKVGGIVKAGENGIISGVYLDSNNKVRLLVGYVGENGIVANQKYKATINGFEKYE